MRNTLTAAVLAIGLIISSALISKFFVLVRHEQCITVKGYAEQTARSHIGTFSVQCTVRDPVKVEAHSALTRTSKRVLEYLAEHGLSANEVTAGAIHSWELKRMNDKGHYTNETDYHELSQRIQIESRDVERVQEVARKVSELIGEGHNVSVDAAEFFLDDLTETKQQVLAAATQDAYRRAQLLAENSGGQVGALVSARQGVFQILEPNTTRTADYGFYDTSTIDKVVKAVVTLEYSIKA